jgi:hypothetical protein
MASVVKRLASRSISGRDLGIDVHNHTAELLHFFFKKKTPLNAVTLTF